MFRKYTPKDNVQKKSYYSDRFYVTPPIPKEAIADERILQDLSALQDAGVAVLESFSMRGEAVIYVAPADNEKALQTLKDLCHYEQLTEMSAVDRIASLGAFEIFYQLLSISAKKRLRVKTRLPHKDPIQTASRVYRSAWWAERECYDMFGVIFKDHTHLTRLLMPDDWVGHPLLKTYPLQGDEFAKWYEVDLVYGKEYREIIGEEIRDAGWIQRYDTTRFARLGKEVPRGAPYSDEARPVQYAPDALPVINKQFDKQDPKIYKKRK
ncbi:MAG: NADH-quinone oxidoreductase subunit C [Helicobacteraceae bacterium]